MDPRGSCRTLAVHQGTGTSVAIVGQVGNLLAQFGEQPGVVAGCAMAATIGPFFTAPKQVAHMRARQPHRPAERFHCCPRATSASAQSTFWAAAGLVDTDLSFLSLLELYGTEISERRMPTRRVVEALDVIEHI